jgi:hypothetical protein
MSCLVFPPPPRSFSLHSPPFSSFPPPPIPHEREWWKGGREKHEGREARMEINGGGQMESGWMEGWMEEGQAGKKEKKGGTRPAIRLGATVTSKNERPSFMEDLPLWWRL